MKFRITIPNDYNSEADSRQLAEWCKRAGIKPADEVIFDVAGSAWPGAEVIGVGDFSRTFEAPAAPPVDSQNWPPLWVEEITEQEGI